MSGGKFFQTATYFRLLLGTLIFATATTRSWSAEPTATETTAGEKALKYHALLLKRPEPGYLFDRFYNTWLDESTVDSLEAFLLKRVDDSKETGDRLLLAFFYAKKGDDIAALEEYRKALAHNPANAATWYQKAIVEARTLDFDTAISDLKKAREQKPDEKLSVQIDKQLGKLLARNRQTAEALKIWQELLAAHTDDEELFEDLIELHIDEGLFKEAAALEEKLIGQTKDEYLAVTRRLRLGDIHHRAGDRTKAIEVYTAALDAVGSDSWLEREILAQVDQMFRREDDLTGLKRLYDDLLKKHAKRIAIHRRYAQLLVELGDHDPAIAAYHEILKLTPGERSTREEYINVLAKIGKKDEAIKELQGLAEQHAKDAELKYRLANLYEESKQTDQAIAAVNSYLETSDGSEYAYLRARLLERLDNKDAAAGVYEKMATKFADSASAQEAYAAFLYATGKKEDAIKRWRSLAKSGDVKQMLQVARTLSTRSENEAALELLKGRAEELKSEPLFLGQLVTTALALKKYDEAIPWAESRVKLAETVTELETSVDQAATAIERADKLEEAAHKLEAVERRSVSETCLLAELLERLGENAKADEVLKKAADAGSLLAVSQQIRLYSQRREWNLAADATRHILELPEGRKSLHVRRLVELYQRDYQLEEALKWVDEWKRLSPGSTTPWVTEARMLQGLAKTEEALKVLRTAVLKFDADEDLRVRLAEFYVETDKPADALRIYWQLYEETEDLNGKLRWAQRLAELAEQDGNVQQLVQDFDERVRSNRQSIVPLLALSEVYRVTDDYEGRRRALTAAAKIKPDDMYLLQQVARVEEQDGDWQAAITTLERAAALDKTNRTREQIARLHLTYGDDDKGFAILFELAGPADADPRTLETTADTLCAMQEWERAADFLTRRLPDHSADYRLRYLMAVALEEAGRGEEAAHQFTQLLSDQEELPTKKQPAANVQQLQMSSYYDILRQLLPTEAYEWFELSQSRYTAYAHRQQGGYSFAGGSQSGGGLRSNIQLPPDLRQVRPMALAHLLTVAATLDEDKQAQVCGDVESHGVKHAKVLMHLDSVQQDFSTVLPEILEKSPDDEAALAMLVMQQWGVRNEVLAPYCSKAVEKFRKSRPQLAFMAAVQAGMQQWAVDGVEADDEGNIKDENPNKYLDEALQIASTFEHPNPMLVMSLTMALGGRSMGAQQMPISETYREKLSQLLVKWYPEMSKSPQWGSWAFYSAMQSLNQNNDPTAYVHFLDDEVARWQTGGKGRNAQAQMQMYMGGNQPQLLAPLAFPPQQLADFPPHVLMAFSTNQNANPFGFSVERASDREGYADKLKPLLEGIKSPILRILFTNSVEGLKDTVKPEIDKLLAAKSPQLDAYLIAASLAGEKEEFAESVRLLQKSAYLPMKQEMRRQVDAAIVAAVLAAKDKSADVEKDLLEAGQQASLRLRRAKLDAAQRAELITAMETLGLKKEAEKLDAIASATQSQSSGSVVMRVTNVPQTNNDRISKLIEQGKRDVAVKQLAAEVSGHARQMLTNMQNTQYYRQQFREVKKRIDAHNLADDVLKAIEPGDSKNVQRIGEYAMTCEIFDRPDKARAAYELALSIRPKDDATRTHLIMLLAKENPSEGGEQLEQLSKSARASFGQMLADQMQDYELPFDVKMGYGRLAVQYLRILDESDLTQAHWVENLMNQFGRNMYGRRGGLPSLYSRKSKGQDSGYQNLPEIMAERRKIHAEMCEQMLKMPGLARTGFRYSLAETEAQEKPLNEFAARAEQILIAEAEAKPSRTNVQQNVYYGNGQTEVRFRSPEEFLARTAWKSGDWKVIDETLLPKLSGGKNRESREQLERLSALYRCDESQFLEKAEAIVKQIRPMQPGQPNDGISIVVDVWLDRELSADLQPMLLKQLKQEVNGQNHYQPPGYVIQFMEGIGKRWDRKRQLAFLEELATIYLGPAEKRDEFIKKNYNRQNINWGTPNGRIYVYGQLMEQLCQRSELMFPLLEHLSQYKEFKPVNNFEHYIRTTIAGVQGRGATATMELLSNSPWLENLENFYPLVVGDSDWEAPLVVLLQQDAKDTAYRKELRELLEKKEASAATFGGRLILAALDQDKNSAAVLEFIGGQLAAIQALPEQRQQDLAALVRGLIQRDASQQKELSPIATAVKEWLKNSHASESREMLAKLEKAKRLEEVGIQENQADEFIRENLVPMIRTDTDAAVKAFLRICELAHEAQRRGQWNMGFGDETTIDGYLLRTVGYSNEMDWPTYNFVADVLRNEKGVKIETGYSISQVASNVLNKSLTRAGEVKNGKAPTSDEKIQAMYTDMGAALGGRPSSLLMAAVYQRINGELNADTSQKALAWAAKEMQGGKYPQLAADLHAVLSLIALEKQKPAAKKTPKGARLAMADYHERIRAILGDEQLSIPWRLHVAEFIAARQPDSLPLDLAKDITKLYAQALEKEIPIVTSQHYQLTAAAVSLEAEESSQELLADWRTKWAARYLRPAISVQMRRTGNASLFDLQDTRALCGALELFLAVDDDDHAKKILHRYSDRIGHLPRTLSVLLCSNRPEDAARTLRSGWPRLALQWPNYNPATDAHLPAMLEKLDRDDERYLAKCVVASMHNGAASRGNRLAQLANEFREIEFKDPAMKKLCLVILSDSDVAGKQVADAVAAVFDPNAVVAAAAGDDQTRITQETRLAQCHFRNRLRENDYAAYVDVINRLSANPSDDDYQFGQIMYPFIECAAISLRDRSGAPWTPDECTAIGGALCNILKDRNYVYFNNFPVYTATLVATHSQTDQLDKLNNWYEKISDNSKNNMNNQGVKGEIWRFGVRLNGPATAENLDARLRYVKNVMRWAFDRQWLQRTGSPYRIRGQNERNLFTPIVKVGLLTADELKANGPKALEGIGPKGEPSYAKAALANWLQSTNNWELASEVWRSMINISPDAKKVARNEANYVLGLAVCLKNLKRFDEARSAMAMLEGKEFDQALKASYEQYKNEIEAAAKAESARQSKEAKGSREATSRKVPPPLANGEKSGKPASESAGSSDKG